MFTAVNKLNPLRIFTITFALIAFNDVTQCEDTKPSSLFRLPTTVRPTDYDLALTVDLEKLTFAGKVVVKVEIDAGTTEFYVHSKDLTITKRTLVEATKEAKEVTITTEEINDKELYKITWSEKDNAKLTSAKLTIEYTGTIKESSVAGGFYTTTYKNGDANERIAATKFKPISARTVFPCFDEPRFRTSFTLSITHDKTYSAVSNVPIKDTKTNNDLSTDIFETILSIPTHSVAFVLTKLKQFDNGKESSNSLKLWARSDAIDSVKNLLDMGDKMLESMDESIVVPHGMSKINLIAIPDNGLSEFNDNWGLVICSENLLKHSIGKTAPFVTKLTVVKTLASAITHQWFGGAFTASSWEYLWLNEGFSSLYKSKLIDELLIKVMMGWKLSDSFFTSYIMQSSMAVDNFGNMPLTRTIETNNDIYGMFDVISSDKGAAVLRMLEHMFGKKLFIKTIKNYLMRSLEKGRLVSPEDLWVAFEVELNKNRHYLVKDNKFRNMVDGWTHRPGYPVLTADLKSGEGINIEQRPFNDEAVDKSTWTVPITFSAAGRPNLQDTEEYYTMNLDKFMIGYYNVTERNWFLLNIQQTGYYRVNYDKANWKELIWHMRKQNPYDFNALDRVQLIDNSFNLARYGKLSLAVPLSLIKYIARESEPEVWITAIKNIKQLRSHFAGTEVENKINELVKPLFTTKYEQLTSSKYEGDSESKDVILSFLTSEVCYYGVNSCIEKVLHTYSETKLEKIEEHMKPTVFCTALKKGNKVEDVWNNLWKYYKSDDSNNEDKLTVLTSFQCLDQEYSKKLLLKAWDSKDKDIREQDRKRIYDILGSSEDGIAAILEAVKTTVDTDKALPSETVSQLTDTISSIRKHLSNQKQVKLLKETSEILGKAKNADESLKKIVADEAARSSKLVEKNEKRLDETKEVLIDDDKDHHDKADDKSGTVTIKSSSFLGVFATLLLILFCNF